MASLIKGIPVILHAKAVSGEDAFRNPIYTEEPVTVNNVLVSPAGTDDVVGDVQLEGKKAIYELSIPKDDAHIWEDSTVEFFGQKWKTFGFCTQYIPTLVPLDWDRKIKVERYG